MIYLFKRAPACGGQAPPSEASRRAAGGTSSYEFEAVELRRSEVGRPIIKPNQYINNTLYKNVDGVEPSQVLH